jgi:hypothetical protein
MAQIGPGGIGNSSGADGQPINTLWLSADSISGVTDGSGITTWSDISGNANDATQVNSDLRPLFIQDGANGMPVARFDGLDDQGGDFFVVADADNLDDTAELSMFVVVKPNNLDGTPRGILSKRVDSDDNNSYSQFFFTNDNIHTDIDSSNNRFSTPKVFHNDSLYLIETFFDGSLVYDVRASVWLNGELNVTAPETSATIPNYASDLNIGMLNNVDGSYTLGGDIAEVVSCGQ